jgi:lipoprotein-releasing system permease protein
MKSRDVFLLARQLFSRRRTGFLSFAHAIALGSVALSSAALLLALAILDGFEYELQSKTALFIGHLDARLTSLRSAEQYQQWYQRFTAAYPGITRVTAYMEIEVLLAHRGNVEAALLHADTPMVIERLGTLGIAPSHITSDRVLALGRPLAERLGVRVGDTIAVFLSAPMATATSTTLSWPIVRRATVGTIYESGMRQFDETVVLASTSTVQSIRGGQFIPTGFTLWLDNPEASSKAAQQLDSLYGASFFVRTYRQIHPAMFTWIALQKRPIPIIIGILSIVAAFNILTLLFVVVVERRHAIAIVRLLGMVRRKVLAMITGYGAWIGMVGYMIGLVIGVAFGTLQQRFGIIRLDAEIYFISQLPIQFSWWHAAVVGCVVLALSLLVTALPALAATRISPLSILRIK